LSLAERETITPTRLIDDLKPVENEITHQIVAEIDGTIIGFGTLFHTPWMKPGCFLVKVWTHPVHRNTGIGSQLYDTATAYAQSKGAQNFNTNLFDNEPHSLQFAESRGFKIERHLFESKIDLAHFDMRPFEDIIEQVKASGIRLFTLADVGNTKENLQKLWQINYATVMDDPGTTGTFPNFEEFYKMTSEAWWFNPKGQFLAADGDQYVGLAAIRHDIDNNTFYNMMTGVMPAYRGRKIALALKLMTIAYAKQLNGISISTDNDSQNAPMLAINRKLGYIPQPGVYRLSKD